MKFLISIKAVREVTLPSFLHIHFKKAKHFFLQFRGEAECFKPPRWHYSRCAYAHVYVSMHIGSQQQVTEEWPSGSGLCIRVQLKQTQHSHWLSLTGFTSFLSCDHHTYTQAAFGHLPCWMTMESSRSFISARSTILSSTVLSVMNLNTRTVFVWPILCARS